MSFRHFRNHNNRYSGQIFLRNYGFNSNFLYVRLYRGMYHDHSFWKEFSLVKIVIFWNNRYCSKNTLAMIKLHIANE